MKCAWCERDAGEEVIFVELRRSTFQTNTPAGRVTVKASRTAPCCGDCKHRLERTPREFPGRTPKNENQIDLIEMLEIVEREGL